MTEDATANSVEVSSGLAPEPDTFLRTRVSMHHVKSRGAVGGRCLECHQPWPCDAILLLAELEKERQ